VPFVREPHKGAVRRTNKNTTGAYENGTTWTHVATRAIFKIPPHVKVIEMKKYFEAHLREYIEKYPTYLDLSISLAKLLKMSDNAFIANTKRLLNSDYEAQLEIGLHSINGFSICFPK
jgi:hypothetical protein